MKKILFVAALFFYPGAAVATDITWDDKMTGGSFTADDANAIKTAVNSKADKTAALVGDCTVGPCLDGSTDGGNLIKLWAGTGSYWTALQGGAPAANRSWRLPIDAPPSAGETNVMTMDEYGQMAFLDKPSTSGYVLSSTDAGVLSWIANGAGAMVYPGAGIPNSTGSAWGTSYSLTTLAAALDGESWTFTGAVDMSGASSVIMGPISFEGATVDAYQTTFSITDPTADRTITVGDFDSKIPAASAIDSSGNIVVAGIADSTTEALGLGTIELGHASDTTIARSGAGAITVEGVGVVTTSSSDTLTNKTLDANGTGNVVKGYGYITFTKPHNRGSATGAVGTTETTQLYGVPSFADDVETNNFVDYIAIVPPDWDSSVDPTATLKFRLGGADTGDHSYKVSMIDIADSAAAAGTPADSITLAYTADASGADGDIETASATLTGWGSAASAGAYWLIRVTRDGDDATNDTSTVDSYPMSLTIRYGFSQ